MKVSVRTILGSQKIPYIGYAAEFPALGHAMIVFFPQSQETAKFLHTGEVLNMVKSEHSESYLVGTKTNVYEVQKLATEQIEE